MGKKKKRRRIICTGSAIRYHYLKDPMEKLIYTASKIEDIFGSQLLTVNK